MASTSEVFWKNQIKCQKNRVGGPLACETEKRRDFRANRFDWECNPILKLGGLSVPKVRQSFHVKLGFPPLLSGESS